MSGPEDDYNHDLDDECDDELEDEFDCHLMPDGQCLAAGSEWCDWECPYRDSELFAGSDAWNKKHKGRTP